MKNRINYSFQNINKQHNFELLTREKSEAMKPLPIANHL